MAKATFEEIKKNLRTNDEKEIFDSILDFITNFFLETNNKLVFRKILLRLSSGLLNHLNYFCIYPL